MNRPLSALRSDAPPGYFLAGLGRYQEAARRNEVIKGWGASGWERT